MTTGLNIIHELTKTSALDAVLPCQFFTPALKETPEHRLMIAVLREAIYCIKKYRASTDRSREQIFSEARYWFLASDMMWPYSFERICAVLGLEPAAVRESLGIRPQYARRPAMARGTRARPQNSTSAMM